MTYFARVPDLMLDAPLSLEDDPAVEDSGKAEVKPNLFIRIMEAIGRSYCVQTSDGGCYYLIPPI